MYGRDGLPMNASGIINCDFFRQITIRIIPVDFIQFSVNLLTTINKRILTEKVRKRHAKSFTFTSTHMPSGM